MSERVKSGGPWAAESRGRYMARLSKLTRQVMAWGEELPDAYLTCRDMGHTWRPYAASWDSQERAYRRELICPRCTTHRVQWVSASGHISHGNAYTYPDGYTSPQGFGRMDGQARDALRLQSTLRMVESAEERGA